MAYSISDIQNWLAANPNATDEQRRAAMNQFGVPISDVATASGVSTGDVGNRYAAAGGGSQITPDQINGWFSAHPGYTDTQAAQAMNQYNVSPSMVAGATGDSLGDVTGRYNAARPAGTLPAATLPGSSNLPITADGPYPAGASQAMGSPLPSGSAPGMGSAVGGGTPGLSQFGGGAPGPASVAVGQNGGPYGGYGAPGQSAYGGNAMMQKLYPAHAGQPQIGPGGSGGQNGLMRSMYQRQPKNGMS